MGNLSNQYISQSFQSLLHLGSDTTASATLTEIQDALGNGIGVFVNTAGNLKVNNHISASQVSASILNGLGNPFDFSSSVSTQLYALENVTSSLINQTGSYATTGSNTFIGNQNITGDVEIIGTLNATRINTLIESSSVIFSSGSNILGDSTSDIQTLNGLVRVSGSSQITGSMGIKGEVSASYISSSRIQGLGAGTVTDFSSSIAAEFYTNTQLIYSFTGSILQLNVATQSLYSSVAWLSDFTASQEIYNTNNNSKWSTLSVFTASIAGTNQFTSSIKTYTGSNDTKWNTLEPLTASFSSSIGQLNAFTSSQNTKNVTLAQFTGSVMNTTASLNTFTSSIAGTNIFTASIKTYTGSMNSYTSSNDTKWTTLQNVTSSLIAKTGSYATTGSNVYTGSQTITGSVYGNVIDLTISSQTASMDLSKSNLFTLTLVSGSATQLVATNVSKGQTTNILIQQPAVGFGTIFFNSTFKFPSTTPYQATAVSSSKDIVTIISFDSSSLYASSVKQLV
jgi:hypothetical protein